MSDNTGIEWADATWNPTRGCSRVSEGCRFCYAERTAARFGGEGGPYAGLTRQTAHGPRWTGEVRLVPEALLTPFKWRRPRRIFVDSMSDVFHPAVPDYFIDQIFGVMLACNVSGRGHAFILLTKRPERMAAYLQSVNRRERIIEQARIVLATDGLFAAEAEASLWDERAWPIPSLWLGVSVEHQPAAEQRIPLLLETPAALRLLSCEPLLGPLDLEAATTKFWPASDLASRIAAGASFPRIDWVIAGGESGANGRTLERDWVRRLRNECIEKRIPFFFKQWGEWVHEEMLTTLGGSFPDWAGRRRMLPGGTYVHVGRASAGAVLDGREWREFPLERPQFTTQLGGGA